MIFVAAGHRKDCACRRCYSKRYIAMLRYLQLDEEQHAQQIVLWHDEGTPTAVHLALELFDLLFLEDRFPDR